MQNLYDVDEFDHKQDTSMNNIVDFLKLEPNLDSTGPASATDSTERTISYESTEDDVSVDGGNDELESEAFIIHDEILAKQHAGIIEVDESTCSPSEIIDADTTSDGHARCCKSNVKESKAEPIHRQQKKLRWGMIEMRLHSVIPGNHPDTREGPPVSVSTIYFFP
jgi:hypothetical protein